MKGIKFNDDMVRAILEGRKTQTRRPLKPQPEINGDRINFSFRKGASHLNLPFPCSDYSLVIRECPFGKVGDLLWARETFCLEHQVEEDQPPPFDDSRPIRWEFAGMESDPEGADMWVQPHYRATDPTPELSYEDSGGEPTVRWKPSIHMPRWASRITLEITDIRIERVQEITEHEAIKEGVLDHRFNGYESISEEEIRDLLNGSPKYAFRCLWDSLYVKKGLGWYANPWVWVIGFRRVEG